MKLISVSPNIDLSGNGRPVKVRMEDLPESAWTYITGGNEGTESIRGYFQSVSWLHRAVEMRAQAVSSMPFEIRRGDAVVDSSADWQGALGFLQNPGRMLWNLEASLTLLGKAYLFRERNRVRDVMLRYISAETIRPQIDPALGLTGFKRNLGGTVLELEVADLVYFWLPDPYQEIGEPAHSPAEAALSAAMVLSNLNEFAAAHLKQGLIKATLLTVGSDGIPVPKEERERLKSWWQNIFQRGRQGAWTSEVVNAGRVEPVIIGEGFKDLENVEIVRERREDISTALGIPQTLLFSNAANFATAKQDDLHFYQKTVVPECEFIEGVLNEQVLKPQGYTWSFLPNTLDIFQEDEKERAQSLSFLVSALNTDLELAQVAMGILGFELNQEQQEMIDNLLAAKEQRREAMAAGPLNPDKAPNTLNPAPNGGQDEMRSHLAKWRKKATRAVSDGKSGAVPFVSDAIPPTLGAAIEGALEEALTVEDVQDVFAGLWMGYP